MGVLLLVAIFLPLLGCPLLLWAGRKDPKYPGLIALLFPVLSTVCILALAREAGPQPHAVIEYPWIPSLGINLSFLIDGLSIFFGLVVSVMGILVTFYGQKYLVGHNDHLGRFFCYLMLFMAAMLGTVFSDNLLMLFVFWELTGLASFLLIGFLHGDEASRAGARMSLLTISLTGLCMMVGLIMIYMVTETFSFSEISQMSLPLGGAGVGWLDAALLFVLIGIFGKSAQFPFHYWLPNAMAAPTPVSAYLHSATMVKLGVFLSARLFPVFVESSWWAPALAIVGLTTLLLGTTLALLSHDLKALLAYSTVSQLGFLIAYYGLGLVGGVEYDYLHILNHVFYKGCLFMVAGVVFHATHTRDIRQLGGLYRRLPLLGVTCVIAAAAMAGLPGTTGFLSKELMFKEIFLAMQDHGGLGAYAIFTVVMASLIKVAFCIRLARHVFFRRETEWVAGHFHQPSLALQIPPFLLALCTLVFGLFPGLLAGPFQYLAVSGLHTPEVVKLALWPGINRELVASVAVVLMGVVVYAWAEHRQWRLQIPGWLQFDRYFEMGVNGFVIFTKRTIALTRADRPMDYLPIIMGYFVLSVGGFLLIAYGPARALTALAGLADINNFDYIRSFIAALIGLSVLGVILLKQWTTQIIALSVAGFLMAFYFVLYRAPDLALTQLLIEVATLILVLLLLGRFPRSAEEGEMADTALTLRKGVSVVISVGVGVVITTLTLLVTAAPHPEPVGPFYADNTVELAAGSNAVNTILVDFRALDTLGEIAVLVIAVLGGLGLLMRYKRTPEEFKEGALGPPGFGIHHAAPGEEEKRP